MTVPRRFIGAWERERLELDGRRVRGIGRAVWLETGGTYADVRAPGAIASNTAFGGRSAWRAPRFTWHHDVDLDPRPPRAIDRGELVYEGDRIVERGSGLAGGASYEEHWRRLPTATSTIAIAAHRHGVAVRVGDHAAALMSAPRCARLWQFVDGRWCITVSLGARSLLPTPDKRAWRLPSGWR